MKKQVKRKTIPRQYKEGYFVEPKQYAWGSDTTAAGDGTPGLSGWLSKSSNVDTISSIGQYGAAAANMLQPSNGDTNSGASALSGALSAGAAGAKLGSAFGPEGTLIGGGIGLVGGAVAGLITGGKKHAAYEQQQKVNTQNSYFSTRGNMQTQSIDPYGNQMAYGDLVGGGDKPKYNMTQTGNLPANSDPYWKANPLLTQHDPNIDQSTPWGYKPHVSVPDLSIQQALHPQFLPSDKQAGLSNSYYPANSIQQLPATPTIHKSDGYYANGASVGLTGKASGKFYVPNAGLRRFAPHMDRVGRPNPLPSNNLNLQDPNTQVMELGDNVQDTPTNSQQNMINIQKGELLIDPNKGKILQEYKGINPLTGGLFEDHAKDKSKESPNNFTLADPGLFVITKKTAKQYKDAVDNNDKISQKTVLMNIRNAKIQKEGGLQPLNGLPNDSQVEQGNYADGDQVLPDGTVLKGSDINTMNGIAGNNVGAQGSMPEPTNTFSPTQNAAPQSGISKFGNALTNYGPALYNIGQGLFGNAQHQAYATPTTNPYASNVIANMPKNVNMQPVINDIYSNQELANKNLESQTNSSAVYRANRQALSSNSNRALSDARMKASEINNQAAGQRAYMYNALGYQNQQEQDKVRDTNLGIDEMNNKATAAKQNLLSAGLSQLQQTTQNEKTNNQKAGMDKYSLELLAQTFPNTKFYNQFQIDYVNKLLARQ